MFQRSLLAVVVAAFVNLACSGIALAAPSYVGPAGCNSCHKVAATSWEMSVHAKAFDLLKPGVRKREKRRGKIDPDKDYTTDKKCLGCHTTGYEKPGGFVDMATTPALAGISCEACHGAGSEYKILHDEKGASFTAEEAKSAGQTFPSEELEVCDVCHLSKDRAFTEKVDKKYKFDRDKAFKNRNAFHKQEDTKEGFDFKMF